MIIVYWPSRRLTALFFFSSRRRHTRLQGDWSSDVCSSDLARAAAPLRVARREGPVRPALPEELALRHRGDSALGRSEERRVGKESRDRWTQEHEGETDDVQRGRKNSIEDDKQTLRPGQQYA